MSLAKTNASFDVCKVRIHVQDSLINIVNRLIVLTPNEYLYLKVAHTAVMQIKRLQAQTKVIFIF